MLKVAGAAALGLAAFPMGWAAAQEKKYKILYFTRSVGFEHSPVARKSKDELSFSEKLLVEEGKKHGAEIVCSKDGSVFDGDLDQYDAFAFYTCGNLSAPEKDKYGFGPVSPEGKKKFLDAIAGGKGFIGFHSASDTYHSKGGQYENQKELDPYIAMLGGEFIVHGRQQKAKMKVTSPEFPGLDGVSDYELMEEWYALKNFAKDLHVILVQDTEGMVDDCYQRPPYPATWARMHGKGRVFFTSLGHREDVWTNESCQKVILAGFAWALKATDFEPTPNIEKVTPDAWTLKK
jgi:type 1 glutamine amidotransferase